MKEFKLWSKAPPTEQEMQDMKSRDYKRPEYVEGYEHSFTYRPGKFFTCSD